MNKENYNNIFISFEGGEGTGKSTAALLVKKKLETKGISVFLTKEPGSDELKFAEDIKKIIMQNNDIDPITELLLFNASRREHIVKKIIPALEKGQYVISDRFSDSTLIYQGIAKGVDKNTIISANNIATQNLEPSLVFVFDLDPKIGLERIEKNRRETNRFDKENLSFHSKIRKGYKELYKSNKKKYILVKACKTPEEISDFILEKIIKHEIKIN